MVDKVIEARLFSTRLLVAEQLIQNFACRRALNIAFFPRWRVLLVKLNMTAMTEASQVLRHIVEHLKLFF